MIEQDEKELTRQKQLIEIARCYKRVALTDDGKKVFEDLEFLCGFNRTSTDKEFNSNQMFFREGMRNVFLHIKNQLTKDTGEKNG